MWTATRVIKSQDAPAHGSSGRTCKKLQHAALLSSIGTRIWHRKVISFRLQRNGRIDTCRPPCRQPASDKRYAAQERHDTDISDHIEARYSKEQSDQKLAGEYCCDKSKRNADRGKRKALPNHHPENDAFGCSQRRAYPNLACAFTNAARQHSVDSYGGQHQRCEGKELKQKKDKVPFSFRFGYKLFHRSGANNRLVFVD